MGVAAVTVIDVLRCLPPPMKAKYRGGVEALFDFFDWNGDGKIDRARLSGVALARAYRSHFTYHV